MIEFRDFVLVFEAPLNEERSLGVIEAIRKAGAEKPIRYVIGRILTSTTSGGADLQPQSGDLGTHYQSQVPEPGRDDLQARTVKPVIVSLWPPPRSPRATTTRRSRNARFQPDDKRNLQLLRAAAAARRGNADACSPTSALRSRRTFRHARGAQAVAACRYAPVHTQVTR